MHVRKICIESLRPIRLTFPINNYFFLDKDFVKHLGTWISQSEHDFAHFSKIASANKVETRHFKDAVSGVRDTVEGNFGSINKSGNIVIPFQFDNVGRGVLGD